MSASRDAAVLEYADGPRAQASLGAEPGLIEVIDGPATWRVGIYGMVCLENGTNPRAFPPSELWRGLVGASLALELQSLVRRWLLPRADFELSLVVGHESDHATSGFAGGPAQGGPRTIPFGAGGDFVAPDVALRLPVATFLLATVRLQDRVYFNELPLFAGARSASDKIAGDLHEGILNAPGFDLIVRVRANPSIQPQVALFAEHLFSRASSIDDGVFVRILAGLALPGRVGEAEPFVSLSDGNGKGLLVARRELEASVGFRYAAF